MTDSQKLGESVRLGRYQTRNLWFPSVFQGRFPGRVLRLDQSVQERVVLRGRPSLSADDSVLQSRCSEYRDRSEVHQL